MNERSLWLIIAILSASATLITSLSITLYYAADDRDQYAAEAVTLADQLTTLETIHAVQTAEYSMLAGMLVREDLQPVRIDMMKKALFLFGRVIESRGLIEQADADAALAGMDGQ